MTTNDWDSVKDKKEKALNNSRFERATEYTCKMGFSERNMIICSG